MWPAVSYIPYTTSSHEQTGQIITFVQFEEGNVLEKERNVEEDESFLSPIDEWYTDGESDDRSIITNSLEDIWYGIQINQDK